MHGCILLLQAYDTYPRPYILCMDAFVSVEWFPQFRMLGQMIDVFLILIDIFRLVFKGVWQPGPH